jgi:Flp pilus assembly protein TadD
MFDYHSEQEQAQPPPLPRAISKRPPPLPPSARRRAIKETAGAPTSSPAHQAVKTEGTDPELDRDIALARARVVRSPNSVTACYRLSTLLMRRGDIDNFDDALQTLLRVMELEPNHPGAHHKLAEVFARRGQYLEALEHLQRARRLGYRTDPDLEAVVANGVKQQEQG